MIAVLCTSTGACLGAFLWLFHPRPASALLGEDAYELAHDRVFRDRSCG